jgi:hypothetical protein
MPLTSRGIPYPDDSDEVDIPQDLEDMAVALNTRVYSAAPGASTARPTLTSGDRGYLLDESDTGALMRWNGTTWVSVGGSSGGGGGGGGSVYGGRFKAATAQNVPATTSGPGTEIAFGTDPTTHDGVTKAVLGNGHVFTLTAAALWSGVLFGRFATNPANGVRDFGLYCDQAGGSAFNEALTAPMPQTVAGQAKGGPYAFCRYLPAGTKIVAYAYNGTGSGRLLEHNGGEWVSLDLWGR